MAGVLSGSSGGEVVKAGVPDSSILYLTVIHEESVEPMPPKKPKLPESKLNLIRSWIMGGLIESAGENHNSEPSLLKLMLAIRDDQQSLLSPQNLLDLEFFENNPISAMAVSPWAPIAAVGRHGGIEFHHLDKKQKLGSIPFQYDIFDLKFSRNGEVLLVAGGRGAHTGLVTLFNVKTGKRVSHFRR